MAEEVDLSASRVTTVTICYSVPIPFMILFTGLRLFVVLRPSSKDPLSFDDYMITFSTGDYIFSHFYDWAIASIKLSILGLYYRIFSTVVFRRVIIGTAVFIFCWLAAMEIGLGLQCIPIERSWDSDVKGTCINLVAFSYFTNITNLVSDIWVFLLPLPIIFGLHVNRKRKLEIAGVFAIGLFTCGVTLARLTVVVSQGSSDFTWAGVPLGILSIYEVLCGIACANLPFLYKLAIGPFKKSASYHSRIGESESGAEYRARQNSSRRHTKTLSMHSEGRMLSRNGNDSTTLIETRSNQNPEIELSIVERSYSMSRSDSQEILRK
ncbi:unnamed protein product [Penicillium roqueforti FM164]|uniref:Genomic scaffold, ProqFM164S02 n=1 Tax=Penicillium roqueforti (strain FM164) TaxID=1365484 RepID=W6Q532_PENRF|nr:unnamed protein product [Penicillium roqueforti FM164]